MASTPESAQARASREASAWLIQLHEDPDDPGLQARFRAWMTASPVNIEAWTAIRHLSNVASRTQPELAEDWQPRLAEVRAAETRAVRTMSEQHLRVVRPGRRWRLGVVAAAIAACFALVVGPTLIVRLQADVMTDTAELRHMELPDGSQITVAAGSAVAVLYGTAERRVQLLKGEAFFQVMPDSSRPFRVAAGDVETSVVGTSFDVRRDARGVTVHVEEGTVQVGSATSASRIVETLKRGQMVRFSWGGQAVRPSVPPPLVASWRQGQLVLHDQTLRDAVDQLRAYYSGTIVLADDALAEKPVTGAFNLNDPEDALRGMAQPHGAKVRRITPWLIVLSAS